jgi:hypothetical protein
MQKPAKARAGVRGLIISDRLVSTSTDHCPPEIKLLIRTNDLLTPALSSFGGGEGVDDVC